LLTGGHRCRLHPVSRDVGARCASRRINATALLSISVSVFYPSPGGCRLPLWVAIGCSASSLSLSGCCRWFSLGRSFSCIDWRVLGPQRPWAQADERIPTIHSDAGRMRQRALHAEMRRRCRRKKASREISYDLCHRAMGWPASCCSLPVENLRACGIRKTVSAILVNFYCGSM
jgi:hypothetical protein